MSKPIKAKPRFYAVMLQPMMELAREHGYNLLINGSLSRDLDIVIVPWSENPSSHIELIYSFCDLFGVPKYTENIEASYLYSKLAGGRDSYVINLFRGALVGSEFIDHEYYVDITFTPFVPTKLSL